MEELYEGAACSLPGLGVLACESLQLAELSLMNLSLNLSSSLGMTGYHANVFGMNPLFETPVAFVNLNTSREKCLLIVQYFCPFNYCRSSYCVHLRCFLLSELKCAALLQQTLQYPFSVATRAVSL